MQKPTFSVSELNGYIKSYIGMSPVLGDLCVIGEISNYKLYPSGHHYFSLKDAEGSLKCVMFRGSAAGMRFRPENGMQVLATGRIAVYERDGVYQLYVSAMIPAGAGNLQLEFERLKAKLEAEGLFDPSRKKPLPEFPETIAVVTSPVGAAVRDIIRILGSRWPLSAVKVVPARVQGAEAPGEICSAIELINREKLADVIIAGRGGGSVEDLWAFNDEGVARAIAASEIPVISAVGHEPDVTIADYAADARASTPSNAAEIAVPDRSDVLSLLNGYALRSAAYAQKRLDDAKRRLESYAGRKVLLDPQEYISVMRIRLDMLAEKLAAAETAEISEEKQKLAALCAGLEAMSPLKVLSRGYSVVFNQHGGIVKSVGELSKGEHLVVRMIDGSASAIVNEISKEEAYE